MDGIHDLGGMHGFDEVPKVESPFHEDWERVAFAVNLLLGLQEVKNLDETRHAVERLPPEDYLALPYFGRWIRAIELLCVEKGVVGAAEIERRVEEIRSGEYEVPEVDKPELSRQARAMFESDRFSRAEDGPEPAYESGQRVTVRNQHPDGHTRVPRYIRRATGHIRKYHGVFPLADTAARGVEVLEPVYSVGFTQRELWGPGHSTTDRLYIDQWESYLRLAAEPE